MSEAARDICTRLLEKDPQKRLGGGPDGAKEIRNHPWFHTIDWEKMYLRECPPPYKPILDHSTDTKHFPKEFTNMRMSPPEHEDHSPVPCEGWKGFSYVDANDEKKPQETSIPNFGVLPLDEDF